MRIALVLGVILLLAGPAGAGEKPKYTHQEYFEHYEGTKTCLECHQDAAEAFFHSQHYQWQGDAPAIVNADGRKLGKMNTMNDFCTFAPASWIGNVHNPDGKVLAQGCSKCHAGLGKLPSPVMSQEQLENIDCLICHTSGYRRDLYQDDQGNWQWRPILWKNQEGLDSVSKRISLPKRKMCLRCHSGSGGGPNFKRGDLEYELADCEPDFDVHMASGGNDMACADCHAAQNHRIRGRGVDLAGTDAPDQPLSCSIGQCHGEKPHAAKVLNHHAEKVFCTVCHIPEFAKKDPTDMSRDWSTPAFKADIKKHTPTIELQSNVQPVYTWFNGNTRHQLMGEPVETDDDGKVGIMVPGGKRKDKKSKIYAFKFHKGVLPILKQDRWLVPMAVDHFFATGDLHEAVATASAIAYGIDDPDFEWIETVRYMGLFHEVQPADKALKRLECHSEDGRLDWQALGYKKDPLLKHLK